SAIASSVLHALSLHDALPISARIFPCGSLACPRFLQPVGKRRKSHGSDSESGQPTERPGMGPAHAGADSRHGPVPDAVPEVHAPDRKSTRLNSSHVKISYAVF